MHNYQPMRPYITIIAFLLTNLCVFAQKDKSLADTTQVYNLLESAVKHNKAGLKDSAEYYFKQAGLLAEKLKFNNGYLKYTGDYTNFLYQELRYTDGIVIANKQLEKSIEVKNIKAEANSYNNLALLNYSMSNMTTAANYYVQALELSKRTKDLFNQRKYNTNLASLFIDIKDYNKGFHYALNGYNIALKLKDSVSIARSLTNLIVVEVFKNKLDDAQKHAAELISIATKNQYIDLLPIGYINLGDIYYRQKKYAQSVEILHKTEVMLPEAPPGYDAYVYHGLANAYKALGNLALSDEYFERCMRNAKETMPLVDLKSVYLLGADLHEATGEYKQALEYRKQYQQVSDSLANQTNHQTIQDIETKYQTSLKEQEITEQKLLLANNQNELSRKNNFILVTSLIILFMLAFVLISIIINRQRNRDQLMNQELKVLEALLQGEERERTRTAKELHDAVASTLSAAKIQINNMKELELNELEPARDKALDLIDTAVKEVRNISHNMAPNVLLDEGLTYAIENFCNKVSNDKLQISSYFFGDVPTLSIEYELVIYRIVQEAVNNIIKHADATEALVQLVGHADGLQITIEDNGKGFDTTGVKKNGIGLSNLFNRIQLLAGSYEIQSNADSGTSIDIHIPMQQATA